MLKPMRRCAALGLLVFMTQAPCALQARAGQESITQPYERMLITEPRNAAAGFAITSWMIYVDSLGTLCAKLDGPTGEDALHALSSWKKRDAPYVDASLTYIAQIEEQLLASQGEDARKQFRDQRKAEFANAAREAQVEWFPEGKATEHDCKNLATHAAQGDVDLDKHAEFFSTLQAIKADMDRLRNP